MLNVLIEAEVLHKTQTNKQTYFLPQDHKAKERIQEDAGGSLLVEDIS